MYSILLTLTGSDLDGYSVEVAVPANFPRLFGGGVVVTLAGEKFINGWGHARDGSGCRFRRRFFSDLAEAEAELLEIGEAVSLLVGVFGSTPIRRQQEVPIPGWPLEGE